MIEPFSRMFRNFGPTGAVISGGGTVTTATGSSPITPTVIHSPGGGGFVFTPINVGNPNPVGGGSTQPTPTNPTNNDGVPDPTVIVGPVREIPLGGIGNTSPDEPLLDKVDGVIARNQTKLLWGAIIGISAIAFFLIAFGKKQPKLKLALA